MARGKLEHKIPLLSCRIFTALCTPRPCHQKRATYDTANFYELCHTTAVAERERFSIFSPITEITKLVTPVVFHFYGHLWYFFCIGYLLAQLAKVVGCRNKFVALGSCTQQRQRLMWHLQLHKDATKWPHKGRKWERPEMLLHRIR